MGNKDSSQILGICDISITTDIGVKIVLKNIRYVPELCLSLLLSKDKLDEDGCTSRFGRECCKLTKASFLVAKNKNCYVFL